MADSEVASDAGDEESAMKMATRIKTVTTMVVMMMMTMISTILCYCFPSPKAKCMHEHKRATVPLRPELTTSLRHELHVTDRRQMT